MKRKLYFLAISAILLSGCTSNDPLDLEKGDQIDTNIDIDDYTISDDNSEDIKTDH